MIGIAKIQQNINSSIASQINGLYVHFRFEKYKHHKVHSLTAHSHLYHSRYVTYKITKHSDNSASIILPQLFIYLFSSVNIICNLAVWNKMNGTLVFVSKYSACIYYAKDLSLDLSVNIHLKYAIPSNRKRSKNKVMQRLIDMFSFKRHTFEDDYVKNCGLNAT